MMRINYFTAPRKVPKFQLLTWPLMVLTGEVFYGSHRAEEIISNETKSVFVLVLIKSFTSQSLRENFFWRGNEWVVFRETGS